MCGLAWTHRLRLLETSTWLRLGSTKDLNLTLLSSFRNLASFQDELLEGANWQVLLPLASHLILYQEADVLSTLHALKTDDEPLASLLPFALLLSASRGLPAYVEARRRDREASAGGSCSSSTVGVRQQTVPSYVPVLPYGSPAPAAVHITGPLLQELRSMSAQAVRDEPRKWKLSVSCVQDMYSAAQQCLVAERVKHKSKPAAGAGDASADTACCSPAEAALDAILVGRVIAC